MHTPFFCLRKYQANLFKMFLEVLMMEVIVQAMNNLCLETICPGYVNAVIMHPNAVPVC